MLVIFFGIVCGITGFAIGWVFSRKSLLIHLAEINALEIGVYKKEFEKDF
jgi:hypothetical protein